MQKVVGSNPISRSKEKPRSGGAFLCPGAAGVAPELRPWDAPQVMKLATIHFDGGGQSPGPVAAACTVELSDGSFDQAVKRFDQGTHNTAEWQALILGLRLA